MSPPHKRLLLNYIMGFPYLPSGNWSASIIPNIIENKWVSHEKYPLRKIFL